MIPDGTVLLEDDTDDFGADLDNHDDDNIDFDIDGAFICPRGQL